MKDGPDAYLARRAALRRFGRRRSFNTAVAAVMELLNAVGKLTDGSLATRVVKHEALEIAVSDPFVEPTLDALCEGDQTGEVGDGKIFVVPLERVVRIRTSETDDDAVTPVRK